MHERLVSDVQFWLNERTAADEEVFQVLQLRLGKLAKDQSLVTEVLSVDGAAACLAQEDREEMKLTQKKVQDEQLILEDFKSEYAKKRVSVAAKASSGRRTPLATCKATQE